MNKISPYFNRLNIFDLESVDAVVFMGGKCREIKNTIKEFPFINAVGVRTEGFRLFELASMPFVRYISPSVRVNTLKESDSTGKIFISSAMRGNGVTIAVLDTGISKHLDFCLPRNRLIEFRDFVDGESDFYDDNGHGTFVAGVASGNGMTSGGMYRGVADNADIVGVKVIGKQGDGSAFDVLDGMQWIYDNHKRLNIKVCCMSFGANISDEFDPLRRGAEALVSRGITVVVASGNDGKNHLKTPAISPDVIAVGAIDNYGYIAPFTSRGKIYGRTKPEIYARGVDIVSTESGGVYRSMSGTSVACPYIAGACALLLEKYPTSSPKRIKEMLLLSSKYGREGELILEL